MDIISIIKQTPTLLNTVINSMSSALFIVDDTYRVTAFNKTFKTMVAREGDLIFDHLCGQVLGCAQTIISKQPCGQSSLCDHCELRKSIGTSFSQKEPTLGHIIEREFVVDGEMIRKFFKFSSHPITYGHKTYTLLVLDDVTEFEDQKTALIEQNKVIRKYNQMYQQELKLAQRVQASLIPQTSGRIQGYALDFKYFPLEKIGGDMFDIIPLDDQRVGVFICDVVGHGIAAALVTAMVKALLASAGLALKSPVAVMKLLNAQLMSLLGDPYMTAIYGVLDTGDHTFTMVRAGHPYPWKIEGGSVQTLGHHTGPMLGVIDSVDFQEEVIALDKGSKILLYTDGLLDVADGNVAYENHLMTLLEGCPTCSGQGLLNIVESDIKGHLKKNDHPDDICIVSIERQE